MELRSLDELEPSGKRVLMRVDFNSPMDPSTGRLLDDKRIRGHLGTIRRLSKSTLVLIAHQSRPGKKDFTTLENHAKRLERLLGKEITYVDDIFGSNARSAIKGAQEGDIVVLENVRFYSEEYMAMEPDEAANTHEVKKLAPLFDAYVNDAFSAAHRSQPSIVGFPQVLPSYAGDLMARELDVLGGLENAEKPRIFALGGAKAQDAVNVIRNTLSKGRAEKILVSGVVGNIFLMAQDIDPGEPTKGFIEKEGYTELVEDARELLNEYGELIETPSDVAVKIDGERAEVEIDELPSEYQAFDIGVETIARYSKILREGATVIVNGPPGVYEEDVFSRGTQAVLEAASEARFSIAGGGDTSAAIDTLGVKGFDHISSGGGAALALLSGQELPGVEALKTDT